LQIKKNLINVKILVVFYETVKYIQIVFFFFSLNVSVNVLDKTIKINFFLTFFLDKLAEFTRKFLLHNMLMYYLLCTPLICY